MAYDILLDETGDLPNFPQFANGTPITAQRIKMRLQTFLGEWILDAGVGMPYHEWSQMMGIDPDGVALFMRRDVQEIEEIDRSEFTASMPIGSRHITISGNIFEKNGTSYGVKVQPYGVLGSSNTDLNIYQQPNNSPF